MFALMWNYRDEYSEIVEFENNDIPARMMPGNFWTCMDVCETREEAEKVPLPDTRCTVMRLTGSDPAIKSNYIIMQGIIIDRVFDKKVAGYWFPKAEFMCRRQAEEYIDSAVYWCRMNLKGKPK